MYGEVSFQLAKARLISSARRWIPMFIWTHYLEFKETAVKYPNIVSFSNNDYTYVQLYKNT